MSYDSGPMTEAMYYVLLTLMNPNHGYKLMNSIQEVSKGRVVMGPGTLYGILSRLLKDGFIRVLEDDGRKKIYGITEKGKEILIEEYKRIQSLIEDGDILKREI